MPSSILLKNGNAILHDGENKPRATKCDVLITGSNITKISPSIEAPSSDTEVIDCTNKIISPGFVDTHHHLWQTAVKGVHADHTLLDYFAPGSFTSSLFSPDDIYWSQLAGALEAIDAGTTTVVDHSHIVYSPEHPRAAIKATVESGLRTIYCYTPTPRIKAWSPQLEFEKDFLADWVMSTFTDLASSAPLAPNNRVTLGFAFDGLLNMPAEETKSLLQRVYDAGVRVVTLHDNGGTIWGPRPRTSVFEGLAANDLLPLPSKPDGSDPMHFIGSHAGYLHDAPAVPELLAKYAPTLSFSSTPSTELNMFLTPLQALIPSLRPFGSLGIDCHTLCSASMTAQMRLLLGHARSLREAELAAEGKWDRDVGDDLKMTQAFNVATISGAKAVGMDGAIGRLQVGSKADVIVLDCDGPGMLGIGEGDEIAGLVGHSGPSDVEHVIVDGIFRKKAGKLVLGDIEVDGKQLSWEMVVEKLRESRARIRKGMAGLDFESARMTMAKALKMDLANSIGAGESVAKAS